MRLTNTGWRTTTGKAVENNPKKSLGQHWLHDPAALNAMLAAADVQATDVVLEIGPGLGHLTKLLAALAQQVIAVELDTGLATELPKRVAASNLEIINEDILRFDLTNLPPNYKLVANIPYYLTSHLIRLISETPNRPAIAALLVQKEVAERVAAPPGAMSLLSVTAQFYWQVELGRKVSAELFTPPPKVDSQILILKPLISPAFKDVDTKLFFHLARIGFSQRRKTLQNSLAAGLHLSKNEISRLCEAAQVNPSHRAQTLSLGDWYRLQQAYTNM